MINTVSKIFSILKGFILNSHYGIISLIFVLLVAFGNSYFIFLTISSVLFALYGIYRDKFKWISIITLVLILLFILYKESLEKDRKFVEQYNRSMIAGRQQARINESIKTNVDAFKIINEITTFLEEEKYKKSYESVSEVIDMVELLKGYTEIYEKLELSPNSSVVKEAKTLRTIFTKHQKSIFPYLRKEYTRVLSNAAWEEDIIVAQSGTTLVLTGGIFAANRNISSYNSIIQYPLLKLRFKKVIYKWYEYDEEYKSYLIYTGADSEPIRF